MYLIQCYKKVFPLNFVWVVVDKKLHNMKIINCNFFSFKLILQTIWCAGKLKRMIFVSAPKMNGCFFRSYTHKNQREWHWSPYHNCTCHDFPNIETKIFLKKSCIGVKFRTNLLSLLWQPSSKVFFQVYADWFGKVIISANYGKRNIKVIGILSIIE